MYLLGEIQIMKHSTMGYDSVLRVRPIIGVRNLIKCRYTNL